MSVSLQEVRAIYKIICYKIEQKRRTGTTLTNITSYGKLKRNIVVSTNWTSAVCSFLLALVNEFKKSIEELTLAGYAENRFQSSSASC